MNQIPDNTAAAKAKYEIEQALLSSTDWQLWEGERLITTLSRTTCELTVEWGKLIFAWWTDDSSHSWRITAYEIAEAELQCQATRGLGRETILFTLRDPLRWQEYQPETLVVAERRAQFSELLTQVIQEHFSDVKIQRVRTRNRFSPAAPSQYFRVLLRRTKQMVLVLGINSNETQTDIDNIITAGLGWFSEQQKPVHRLWLCVPHGRGQTVLERLTLLDTAPHNLQVECFEINEKERSLLALRPVSQAELLNLHPRGLLWPELKDRPQCLWRERVVKLAPDLIEVREDTKFESYAIHGLEFARTKGEQRERLLFGVAQRPDEITEKLGLNLEATRKELIEQNFTQLEKLVREIIAYRRAETSDLRHPFYRLRTEAWLEALLRRDIRVLDASLNPRFVYAQIPTWLGDDRSVLDLLTINHEGRLVVIEIKAVEDAHLPLQGVDYWLRVEQARVRGEFARRGLFAGIKLADQSPLLYLVAPRLRFHRSFRFAASCIAPEIEAYRIGLNTNWRRGIKVQDVEKLWIEKESSDRNLKTEN